MQIAVGFNVETVTFNNLKLQVWDLGGQTGLRPYWRCYYQDTNAVVYVMLCCSFWLMVFVGGWSENPIERKTGLDVEYFFLTT